MTGAEIIAGILGPYFNQYLGALGPLVNKGLKLGLNSTGFFGAHYNNNLSAFGGAMDAFDSISEYRSGEVLENLDALYTAKSAEAIANLLYTDESERNSFKERYSDSWLINLAQKQLDPFSTAGMDAVITRTASNLNRRHMAANINKGTFDPLYLDRVTKAFSGVNGKAEGLIPSLIGNLNDYSGFTAKDIADLGSEILAADSSYDFSKDKAEESTKRLRTQVQKMTKALQPLKDLFGKDIKQLLNTVEAITGVNMVATPDAAQYFAAEAAATMRVTGATVQNIGAASGLYQKALQSSAGLGAGYVALQHIQGTANLSVNYATSAMLQRIMGKYMIGTANSTAVTDAASAYGYWKAHGHENGTVEEFEKAVADQTTGTLQSRLVAASGAGSLGAMRSGMYSSGYGDAMINGVGVRLADSENQNMVARVTNGRFGWHVSAKDLQDIMTNDSFDKGTLKDLTGSDDILAVRQRIAAATGAVIGTRPDEARAFWVTAYTKAKNAKAARDMAEMSRTIAGASGGLSGGYGVMAAILADKGGKNTTLSKLMSAYLGGGVDYTVLSSLYKDKEIDSFRDQVSEAISLALKNPTAYDKQMIADLYGKENDEASMEAHSITTAMVANAEEGGASLDYNEAYKNNLADVRRRRLQEASANIVAVGKHGDLLKAFSGGLTTEQRSAAIKSASEQKGGITAASLSDSLIDEVIKKEFSNNEAIQNLFKTTHWSSRQDMENSNEWKEFKKSNESAATQVEEKLTNYWDKIQQNSGIIGMLNSILNALLTLPDKLSPKGRS